jgi:predicted alpha-1,2-mannosidase
MKPDDLSRRSFLKTTGATSIASLLPIALAEGASAQTTAPPPTPSSLVTLVNILQGTNSTPEFSRGNTLPIAARPFGMAHWTLQNHDHTPWMFAPNERRIQGFRCTHQLSPWLGDYGHAVFLPFTGSINPNPGPRAASYRTEAAKLFPHTLQLHLTRYGVDTELIPTERGCLITASFAKPGPGFLFDIPADKADKPAEIHPDPTTRTIAFTSTAAAGGVPPGFATYYLLHFSEPWSTLETKQLTHSSVTQVHLAPGTKSVEVRIATSFISFEQARLNLDRELGAQTPTALRDQAEKVWNDHLGRIEVSGGSLRQQQTLYSCLYRTLLFPRVWHEPDATGALHHRSAYNGQITPGVMYADHGYWDVYRAWYPFMTILFPERLAEILQAWVNAYQEGGWLPQFPCPGYRACMTGSLIDSVFGDAASKSIPGFDLATAYAGLKKHATQPGNPDAGYGRRGLTEYLQYGYDPAGLVSQSAAETVDAAYGDFCIAQVAKALGNQADYQMFMKRSEAWKKLFDPRTGFLRGKKADGSFLEPFDPITWGDPYVEGAAWQHRFDAPHDFAGLTAALGGPDKLIAAVEKMLAIPPDFNVGVYGQEIHEMSEMAAVPYGQYAHSNQPSHQILYLFAAAGRPDLTRHWTRRVMEELYSPEMFAGDEDTGSMAAWYVLSALGFYQLCPGKPEYTFGRALFPSAKVHLPGGKTLTIEDAMQPDNRGAVKFNGKAIGASITHAELIAGGKLRFEG